MAGRDSQGGLRIAIGWDGRPIPSHPIPRDVRGCTHSSVHTDVHRAPSHSHPDVGGSRVRVQPHHGLHEPSCSGCLLSPRLSSSSQGPSPHTLPPFPHKTVQPTDPGAAWGRVVCASIHPRFPMSMHPRACVLVHPYIHAPVCVQVSTNPYALASMCPCFSASMCPCIHTSLHLNIHVSMCQCIPMSMCSYTCAPCALVHLCIHMPVSMCPYACASMCPCVHTCPLKVP